MNEHVHVSLVFSRSGQKLSVRLPRDIAQSANSLSESHLANLIDKAQQLSSAARPEAAYAVS
jgi:hypothetical protein